MDRSLHGVGADERTLEALDGFSRSGRSGQHQRFSSCGKGNEKNAPAHLFITHSLRLPDANVVGPKVRGVQQKRKRNEWVRELFRY